MFSLAAACVTIWSAIKNFTLQERYYTHGHWTGKIVYFVVKALKNHSKRSYTTSLLWIKTIVGDEKTVMAVMWDKPHVLCALAALLVRTDVFYVMRSPSFNLYMSGLLKKLSAIPKSTMCRQGQELSSANVANCSIRVTFCLEERTSYIDLLSDNESYSKS